MQYNFLYQENKRLTEQYHLTSQPEIYRRIFLSEENKQLSYQYHLTATSEICSIISRGKKIKSLPNIVI